MPRTGVLALQGAFAEHVSRLRSIGADAREVRLPRDLQGLDALIIPGGESTTFQKLLVAFGLVDPLADLIRNGLPVYGTCAGLIVLAREVLDGAPSLLPFLDVQVRRNAFGRQVDSFEIDLRAPAIAPGPVPAVFIRAPRIIRTGPGVEVLATLPDGEPVLVRQGSILASSFHPELTGDRTLHRFFLETVAGTGVAQVR